MKTKEELNALKNEVKDLNAKLAELNEEELREVTGGTAPKLPPMELAGGTYADPTMRTGGITVEDWIVQEYEVTL